MLIFSIQSDLLLVTSHKSGTFGCSEFAKFEAPRDVADVFAVLGFCAA